MQPIKSIFHELAHLSEQEAACSAELAEWADVFIREEQQPTVGSERVLQEASNKYAELLELRDVLRQQIKDRLQAMHQNQ